jgi:hypothetical protein
MVVSWTDCREDARCKDADRVLPMVGESAGVPASVEEYMLGGVDTNSCMNMNIESILALLGPATMAQLFVGVADNSVETSRRGV